MFVSKVRDNGERFVALADDAPGWLRDAVMEAHDGEFPNDWRFDMCRAILDSLVEAWRYGTDDVDSLCESAHVLAEELVDVYNGELSAWLAGDLGRAEYVEQWAREYGWSGDDSLWGLLTGGQVLCVWSMADVLAVALTDAYSEYVEACEAEELAAYDLPMWWGHGCPGGPVPSFVAPEPIVPCDNGCGRYSDE